MIRRISTDCVPSRPRGFSLMTVLIAISILSFVLAAGMSTMFSHRVKLNKDKDIGIARDFMIHYLEMVKAMPFDEIQANQPIGELLDGQDGAPNIRLPISAATISLANSNYQRFYPELVWLEEQNPTMIVRMKINEENEAMKSKYIGMEVTWESPLGEGQKQTLMMDILRTPEL